MGLPRCLAPGSRRYLFAALEVRPRSTASPQRASWQIGEPEDPTRFAIPQTVGEVKSVAEIVLVLVARMIALENLAENILAGGGKFCSGRRDLDQWRPAECALSCMCLIVGGQAVSQDYVAAHMWFNLAAAGGVKDAPTNRDLVAAKMTPQQIAEAEKRFTEWRPSGPIL